MQVNENSQVTEKSGPPERPGIKLAIPLAGGAFAVALAILIAVLVHLGIVPARSAPTPQPRMQLTVRLDTSTVPQLVVRALSEEVRGLMRETRIGFAAMAPSGDSVEVTVREGGDPAQAMARLREVSRQGSAQAGTPGAAPTERFTITPASGGVLSLVPTPAAIADGLDRALDQTIDVLGRRLGDLKPTFRREGDDRIVIALPRQPDVNSLKAFIMAPGRLTFRFIDVAADSPAAKPDRVPPQSELLHDQKGESYVVEKRVAMSGETLTDAQPGFDRATNQPIVSFRFNAAGTKQFARITAEKVGAPFAIVLDGVVLAAPILREPITGGSGQISGNFTVESANHLAILLRSGALPAQLDVIEEHAL
jgi:preprotein translocase subunit SecD